MTCLVAGLFFFCLIYLVCFSLWYVLTGTDSDKGHIDTDLDRRPEKKAY
jgi:hypothetical protein